VAAGFEDPDVPQRNLGGGRLLNGEGDALAIGRELQVGQLADIERLFDRQRAGGAERAQEQKSESAESHGGNCTAPDPWTWRRHLCLGESAPVGPLPDGGPSGPGSLTLRNHAKPLTEPRP